MVFLMKIFVIKSYDVVSESLSDAIYKRKINFRTKLQPSVNTVCRLIEKNIIDKLCYCA